MKKDLAKQIYKDSGWQIDKDTKTTDYKPAPYCIFGEANAGKVPVGTEDGLIEFKDYNGGSPAPTELPIAYYETYDATKIISGYLTFFNSGSGRGLWYRDSNNAVKQLFTNGEYPEGYITSITKVNNGINFAREDLPILRYRPNVYKHSVGIRNNIQEEFVVIEVVLNAETPPTINELLANKQLTWDFGLPASYIDSNGEIMYCRLMSNGTNFIVRDATSTTWNATDCIIAFDNVINLLDVAEEI